MNWQPPPKPAELTESRLIEGILDGHFPIGSTLPGERDLAALLGTTRPTLREALQRLARDGWIEIRHGHPTRVRDYWREGHLAVLVAIVQRPEKLPPDIVPNLLTVRLAMAPAYTALAVSRNAANLSKILESYSTLSETTQAYTIADWQLHHTLTVLSENPVFTLMLNGFRNLYSVMGLLYFANPAARAASHKYYADLLKAARAGDPGLAASITQQVMKNSIEYWNTIQAGNP